VDDRTEPGGGYRRMTDVLSDEKLTARLLDQALTELKALQRKYKMIQALIPVFRQAEKLRLQIEKQKQKSKHWPIIPKRGPDLSATT